MTAKNTTNRYGKRYIHYFCCRKERRYQYCPEGAVREEVVEAALTAFLDQLVPPRAWSEALLEHLARLEASDHVDLEAARRRLENLVRNADQQGERLRDLLRREVISEEDYLTDRSRLLVERKTLGDDLARLADPTQLIEPFRSAILALNRAAKVFAAGEPDERRALIEAVTWNLALSDKKLHIVAKKPFALIGSWSSCPSLSG